MLFDLGCEAGQGSEGLVSGRSDGGGKVGSDAAGCEIGPDGVEGFGGGLHDIVSGTAVNVDIDVGWDESGFGKAMRCGDALMIAGERGFRCGGCDGLRW